MRKAVVAVLSAAVLGLSAPAGPAQAVPQFHHTVAPKAVKARVQKAALRYAAQYVVLRRQTSRAAAARELSLRLSVRAPRHGSHTYVATLAYWRSRAAIGLRPGYSVNAKGRAVPDTGPKACATINLAALERRRPRLQQAVRVQLGTVATSRARCIKPR